MNTYLIICVIYSLINSLSSIPAGSPSTTSVKDHKNINLLPEKSICGKNSLEYELYDNQTSITEFPWVALLRYKKLGEWTNAQCAGILINERYVLTAAHCLSSSAVGDLAAVRLGEQDLDKEIDCDEYLDHHLDGSQNNKCAPKPIEYEVEKIILHSDFNRKIKNYDIALIRLKENVEYSSFIKPICLPLNGEKTTGGEILIGSWWGLNGNGDRNSIKLKVKLPVFNQTMCKNVFSQITPITDSHLCAGGELGVCRGDGGGPLMGTYPNTDTFYLEGIVSFGFSNCAKAGVPEVYTRVANYVEWILDNLTP